MKKILLIFISIIVLIVISFTIYWNLPISITRHSDIEYGNSLIQNVENYRKSHHKLPENNDWETLEKLGFKPNDLGTQPDYSSDGTSFYEITYLDSFDGPYLIWNSNEKEWSIDFPKLFKKKNR
ncbi:MULTISPECIES: hypothetical protein [Chryseobacterium]|uniref:hypothetical protein n=1 Tax=Chryseobacterium TaxID=59732 RepID=UPI0012976B4E|nr:MULTISPECIES: hypothetical protein [Chryseobacterium]MDR6919408.1 uncharacterized protein YxeA [Chryseobacterium sp. 2987]